MQISELNQTLNLANSEKNELKIKFAETHKQLNLKIEHLNDEIEDLNAQILRAENNHALLKASSVQTQIDLENEVEYFAYAIEN